MDKEKQVLHHECGTHCEPCINGRYHSELNHLIIYGHYGQPYLYLQIMFFSHVK